MSCNWFFWPGWQMAADRRGALWDWPEDARHRVGGVSRSDSAVRLIALKLARNFHANAGQVKAASTAGGFFISPSIADSDRRRITPAPTAPISLSSMWSVLYGYRSVGRAPAEAQQISIKSIGTTTGTTTTICDTLTNLFHNKIWMLH